MGKRRAAIWGRAPPCPGSPSPFLKAVLRMVPSFAADEKSRMITGCSRAGRCSQGGAEPWLKAESSEFNCSSRGGEVGCQNHKSQTSFEPGALGDTQGQRLGHLKWLLRDGHIPGRATAVGAWPCSPSSCGFWGGWGRASGCASGFWGWGALGVGAWVFPRGSSGGQQAQPLQQPRFLPSSPCRCPRLEGGARVCDRSRWRERDPGMRRYPPAHGAAASLCGGVVQVRRPHPHLHQVRVLPSPCRPGVCR